MIKVTENGVPLSAIARIEFDPARLVYRPRAKREPTACNAYYSTIRQNPVWPPLLNLPMTEAEAKRLHDEWAKQWPEVTHYFHGVAVTGQKK